MAVMRSGDVAQNEVRDLINRAIDDYTAAHNRDDIAQFAVIGAAYLTPWLIAHAGSVIACIGTFVLGVMYAAWQQLIIEDVGRQIDDEMTTDDRATIVG